ncbi:MAG: radical SAM family heme chaperone HemW [Veillonellaceae bacterium]|nr:radical SAM family heme chaperone HemW [Veillonellaceae bacterium]
MNLGLYLHIPFCRQKCLYCDFPSYTNMEYLYNDYVAALSREIAAQGGICAHHTVDTIYIGGGTPTLLSNQQIGTIMNSIRLNLNLAADAEISIEANPGTVDYHKLVFLKEYGINRISFGVQCFSDRLLSKIGRIHSSSDAVETINMARKAGFDNINIDLMYGLPGQTTRDLRHSIETAASLNIQHLSIYGLKVEEDTPFAELQVSGKLDLPNDNDEEEMYDLAAALAPHYGYERYEISNYARLGFACKHNLKYWRYQPYLGLGVSAHTFWGKERRENTTSVAEYIKAVNAGRPAVDFRETITTQNAMAEYVFLALRTVSGLRYEDFNSYFEDDFLQRYQEVIQDLEQRNLIIADSLGVRMTEIGMKYGNIVFLAFMA